MKAGLIGKGIAGSLTPAMHEAEGRAQGFDYHYARFDTERAPWAGMRLADILDRAEAAGLSGVNITHPFKVEAAKGADALVGAAQTLGAVNTMVFEDGRRIGHNTDHAGFRASLKRDLAGAAFGRVLLIGAGGAGAAVALALLDHGVERLLITDRAPELANALAQRLAEIHPRAEINSVEAAARLFAGLDGVVNATPVGMDGHPGTAIDVALLAHSTWVADIVYFPLETRLLSQARSRGLRVMTGAGMAVFQAVGSFELFTGRRADVMRIAANFERLQREKERGQEARST